MKIVFCVVVFDIVAVLVGIFVIFVLTVEGIGVVVAVGIVGVDVVSVVIDIDVVIVDVVVVGNLRVSVLNGIFMHCVTLWQFINLLRSGRTGL